MKDEKELTPEEIEFKKHKEGLWDTTGEEQQEHKFFLENAAKTNSQAYFILASYFLFGAKNYKVGFDYANKGMQNANMDCYALIGKCYENGFGVKQDYSRAANIYEELTKQGNTFATYALANLYLYGNGVVRKPRKAREMFETLANNGHPKAKYKLGILYENGLSTDKNFQKAFYWYKRAVDEHDFQKAYYNLGCMYLKGKGTEVDLNKAFECFSVGAENHDDKSLFMLAKCHFRGLGTDQNTKKAIKLLKKSDKKGVDTAKSYLEKLVGYTENSVAEQKSVKQFFENQMNFN